MQIGSAATCYRAELALLNQAATEVRAKLKAVGAKENGKLQLLAFCDLPRIGCHENGGVRAIALAKINRVAGDRNIAGDQASDVGKAVIADSDPAVGVWIGRAPGGSKIDVAVVSGQIEERLDSGTGEVSGRKIDRVVAFAHVECSTIHLDGTNSSGDQWIGVSVTISVGVCG